MVRQKSDNPYWHYERKYDPYCDSKKDKEGNGLLTEFVANQPFTNNTTSITLPNSPSFVDLARVRLTIDDVTDRVFLTATVGWESFTGTPNVRFSIIRRRLALGTEDQIFSTIDGIPGALIAATTSFTFVDDTPIGTQGQQLVEYILRASNQVEGNVAIVDGPVILTAAEIEANC